MKRRAHDHIARRAARRKAKASKAKPTTAREHARAARRARAYELLKRFIDQLRRYDDALVYEFSDVIKSWRGWGRRRPMVPRESPALNPTAPAPGTSSFDVE